MTIPINFDSSNNSFFNDTEHQVPTNNSFFNGSEHQVPTNNSFFNGSEHQVPTNSSVFKDSKNQVPRWLDDVFNLNPEINPNPSRKHHETQQQQTTTNHPWKQRRTENFSTDDSLNSRLEVKISETQSTVNSTHDPLNPLSKVKISENQSTVKPTDDPLNPQSELKISENQSTAQPINSNNFDLTRDDQNLPNLPHEQKSESNASLSQEMTKVTVRLSYPKRVLLMAYMRGGSSFLGQMFATNPEAIFWFELVDPMYGAMMGLRIYNNAYEVTHFRNGTRR